MATIQSLLTGGGRHDIIRSMGCQIIHRDKVAPIEDGANEELVGFLAMWESDALFLCIISLFLPYLGGSCPRNFFLVVAPTLRSCDTRTK